MPVIALIVVKGAVWSNLNVFWLDLAWASAVGCFPCRDRHLAPAARRPFLNSILPRSLGSLLLRHRGWITGGALAGRAAHEIKLVGYVDELTRSQLPTAYGQPVGQVRRFHPILATPQRVLDRAKDAA